MRFIPTTTAKIDTLKKQAKRLQRNGGGKHAYLLNRVARMAGYEQWHHVILCHRETEGIASGRSLASTIAEIVRAELAGEARIVVTGAETSTAQPFMLVATGIGDAWLLDPIGQQAVCLVWRGERQSPEVRDLSNQVEIRWEGTYALRGDFFEVDTDHPEIGHRAIGGYPVDQLRAMSLPLQSAEQSIKQVISQEDAVALTPDVVARLVHSGWSAEQLDAAARQGARFSPSRNSVLFPAMGGLMG
ncbi:MAG TPA: hypothetical protein VMV87_07140 [Burkholderiales bacterium]|nr:hypothetical protein [Burkholderiales bacterium]